MWSRDDHQRARAEGRVEAAGRVGQDDDPRAEPPEQQDRLDDEARVVALVQVEAALEHDDRPAAEPARAAAARRGPARSRPASRAGRRTGSRPASSRSSARPPRPEPRTIPTSGHERASGRGRRPRARRAGRAGRPAGCGRDGSIGPVDRRSCGPPGARPGGRRPRPAASSARREYRHRDADHVPSGATRTAGRGETAARRGQRSARSDRRRNEESLMRSRVLRSLTAPSGKTYGTGRAPDAVNAVIHELRRGRAGAVSTSCRRLWTACGEATGASSRLSRRSRTSRPSAASTVAAERSSE